MAGVEVSAGAPAGAGEAIRRVVADVFLDGLAQATLVAVGVSLVSAVVGAWALRPVVEDDAEVGEYAETAV